jgi:four helix bundle protein
VAGVRGNKYNIGMDAGFKKLIVYQLSFDSAMKIYEISKKFPREELFSLTDQIRRSSRSVCSNLAEAYRKRRYPKHFTSKVSDADGEASETQVWIDFAFKCAYIDSQTYNTLINVYIEIGKMLGSMENNPEKFLPK